MHQSGSNSDYGLQYRKLRKGKVATSSCGEEIECGSSDHRGNVPPCHVPDHVSTCTSRCKLITQSPPSKSNCPQLLGISAGRLREARQIEAGRVGAAGRSARSKQIVAGRVGSAGRSARSKQIEAGRSVQRVGLHEASRSKQVESVQQVGLREAAGSKQAVIRLVDQALW